MKIADIVTDDHREGGSLEGLKESISTVGLLHPVTVVRDEFFRPGGKVEGHRLIAGRRRLLACQELGWEDIPVLILESDDKQLTEAAELDENLVRKNLSVLEEGEWWRRKRILYEQINGAPNKGGRPSQDTDKTNDNLSPVKWSEILSRETGEPERTIERRERIAKLDGNTKDRVKEIGLDNDLGRLTKLAAMSEGERHKVLKGVNSPEEFDAKLEKKKTNKTQRQKSAEEFAALLFKHMPPALHSNVEAYLKTEGAKVLLSAFRRRRG